MSACVLAHAFCNWCGLPRFWGRVEAGEVIGPVQVGKGRGTGKRREGLEVADGRLAVGWTVAYYVLLVTGAVGFWKTLWLLTESEGRLADLGRS